jgi:antitoxin ParD1/3/4
MTTVTVTLPESLKEFVDAQIAEGGHGSVSDYVIALLKEAQKRKAWDKVESLVLEGLQSPTREMTKADWEDLHRRVDHESADCSPSGS